MPTVLVVDDSPSFRSAARRILAAGGYTVVGEAPDGRTALEAVADLAPDVVVLDVQLPDLDGFAVAERMAARGVEADVVLVSTRAASDYGDRVREAHVRGFVHKGELSGDALADVLGR